MIIMFLCRPIKEMKGIKFGNPSFGSIMKLS